MANQKVISKHIKDINVRLYWSKKEYSFAHESNFRHATEQEIAAGPVLTILLTLTIWLTAKS